MKLYLSILIIVFQPDACFHLHESTESTFQFLLLYSQKRKLKQVYTLKDLIFQFLLLYSLLLKQDGTQSLVEAFNSYYCILETEYSLTPLTQFIFQFLLLYSQYLEQLGGGGESERFQFLLLYSKTKGKTKVVSVRLDSFQFLLLYSPPSNSYVSTNAHAGLSILIIVFYGIFLHMAKKFEEVFQFLLLYST